MENQKLSEGKGRVIGGQDQDLNNVERTIDELFNEFKVFLDNNVREYIDVSGKNTVLGFKKRLENISDGLPHLNSIATQKANEILSMAVEKDAGELRNRIMEYAQHVVISLTNKNE